MEEDLESGDPSQGVHGLPLHDVGSGLLVEVLGRDDCKGRWVRAMGEKALDYASTLQWEAPEGGPVCPQLQS